MLESDIVPAQDPGERAPERGDKSEKSDGLAGLWAHDALESDPSLYVRIIRELPPTWGGLSAKGVVETDIRKPFDESYIIQKHGGGRFRVQLMCKSPSGGHTIRGHCTVEIATTAYPPLTFGQQADKKPPVVEAAPGGRGGPPSAETSFMAQSYQDALADRRRHEELERNAHREREESRIRAVKAEHDATATTQMSKLEAQMAEIRARTEASREHPAERPSEVVTAMMSGLQSTMQPLLTILADRGKSDGPDLSTLIEAHRAELSSLRETHKSELAALRDAHEREREQRSRDHDRDLRMFEGQWKAEKDTLLATHASEVRILEAELGRVRADVTQLRDENRNLQAQARPTDIMGQIANVAKLRDAAAPLFGTDDGPKTIGDRLLDRVLQSPQVDNILGGVANRIGMGPASDEPAPPRTMRRPPASARRLPQAGVRPTAAATEPVAPRAPAAEPTAPQQVQPGTLLAVLVEAADDALRTNKPAASFAQEIAQSMPAQTLADMMSEGPDAIVHTVVEAARSLGTGSLTSVAGRKYLRDTVTQLLQRARAS